MNVSKKLLKIEFLKKRKALTEEEVRAFSKKIHDWLFMSIPIHAYSTIHTFLPIKQNNEVDTWLIINNLRRDFSSNIVVPRMKEDGLMDNYLLTPSTKLVENAFKIQEPVADDNKIVDNATIDLVLVPLLAFDKKGNRVGYGKGYYDRFLACCRPDTLKIGVSFFEPIDEVIETNNYDIKLNQCITPKGIWSF